MSVVLWHVSALFACMPGFHRSCSPLYSLFNPNIRPKTKRISIPNDFERLSDKFPFQGNAALPLCAGRPSCCSQKYEYVLKIAKKRTYFWTKPNKTLHL